MSAALTRSNEVIQVLLTAGADPNIIDSNGNTALTHAIQSEDISTMELLCSITKVGRKGAFRWIGEKRLDISDSEPVLQFIRDSLATTGAHTLGGY